MYLVMVDDKPTTALESNIYTKLNRPGKTFSYDGESTKKIEEQLKNENNEAVIVSADSRLLSFVHKIFDMNNVFIYSEKTEELKSLQECTKRQLRLGHNLVKLYESGEFLSEIER